MTKEIFSAPSHREIIRIKETESGVIIKASKGQFATDVKLQAQPRRTPWDRQYEVTDTINKEIHKSTSSDTKKDTVIFEA